MHFAEDHALPRHATLKAVLEVVSLINPPESWEEMAIESICSIYESRFCAALETILVSSSVEACQAED